MWIFKKNESIQEIMKTYIKNFIGIAICSCVLLTFAGCDNLLDLTPLSTTAPTNYLRDESHLLAYITNYYTSDSYSQESGRFDCHNSNPTGSSYWRDTETDNAIGRNGDILYLPGEVKVGESGGNWSFSNIYPLNYYLETVVPRLKARSITGAEINVKHYVGEGYFLRAQEYFFRLRKLGDFPIITKVLPDIQEELVEASKRYPRNEVARFIINDLDSAINLLTNTPPGGRVRITKNAALLLKARVALFEATWLKYHSGTALVPQGQGWPGKTKDYKINTVRGEQAIKDYQFPTDAGLQGEINFFLDVAMSASKQVADVIPLVNNSKTSRETFSQSVNPYYDMFSSENPTAYQEAIMYRTYGGDVKHGWNQGMYFGYSMGYTHQMEACFLMENGLPIYAAGSGYQGDNYIQDTKKNRDWRWRLFMKAPGETRALFDSSNPSLARDTFPNPAQIHLRDYTKSTSTGYLLGKGISYDYHTTISDYTAFIVFRAAEAYLTYIEACYERTGSIDATADQYWRAIRTRAGVDPDYNKTIAATDMSLEALTDWGAYSHGQLIDATLYNIRRERRCEFISEGHRWTDLLRWRALDQLNGFHLEGCKIWGPMKSLYKAANLLYNQANDSKNLMSDPALSTYLRLLQISRNETNKFFKGYFFTEAHYLEPIAIRHFLITAPDGQTPSTSIIYQNPKWPTQTGMGAIIN